MGDGASRTDRCDAEIENVTCSQLDLFSPASGASSSGSSGQATGPSAGKSRPIPGAEACSRRTGPASNASTTSATSAATTSNPWISSAEAFRVRMCPQRARELACLVLEAAYGGSFRVSSASSVPPSLLSKTSHPVPTVGLMPFVASWNDAATRRFRYRLRLVMSVHRIAASACSSLVLLPTPTASSYGTSGNGDPGDGRGSYAHQGTPSLMTLAQHGLLPTPTSSEHKAERRIDPTWRAYRKGARLTTTMLNLPTPTAGDAKASGSRCTEDSEAHPGTSLTDAIVRGSSRGAIEVSGHLSPRFVEWMMGLCLDWTKHACDPLETPLFRSVRR